MKAIRHVVVIYHGSRCLDGFGSAFAAYRYFCDKEGIRLTLVAAKHGDAPPDCKGYDVFILDFAYDRETTLALCDAANSVTILDHHESAMQALLGLENEVSNLKMIFDMGRSGAVISWEYFHNSPLPTLLAMVQDRDLWRFKIPTSKDVTAALMSYPFEMSLWETFCHSDRVKDLAVEGAAINRFRNEMIKQHAKKAVMGSVAGHIVPVVNCPGVITSELLSELAKGQKFAAGYSDAENRRSWSLRSTEEGLNVAEVAKLFGGGGHPRAAGFSTSLQPDHFLLRMPD